VRITDKSIYLYGCPRRFGIRRDACINFVHVGEILDVGQKHVYRNQVFNLKTGIPILEITMTVPHALDVLAKVVKLYDDAAVVGAGTVTNAGDAQRCIKAGAKFLVTPGLSIPVLTTGKGLNTLAIYRRAFTPTEVMNALEHGARAIKIFPCSSGGGPAHQSAARTFPNVALIPTGGVNASNAAEYLAARAFAQVAAVKAPRSSKPC
jgi:Entner-Doudoroff aldolase